MKPAEPLRLLLADDHPVVRAGLAAVLKFDPRFTVVAEAADGHAAIAAHREHRPDITLMDVRMPHLDGIEAARRIRVQSPGARILMLTTYNAEEDIRRAMDAGASGYLLKDSSQDDLITALLAVHRGEKWLPANIARRLREHTQEAPLSPRQFEVLELLSKGLSNKEIASVLGFTTDGTKAHLRTIFAKLGVADRTEAVVHAIQRGLIRVE